jgi:hypothetical protein
MELLVRVVDKVNPSDPAKNRQLTKRGDVIAAFPDGHQWGTQERANPDWRIIRVSGMTQVEAESFLSPEHPPDLVNRYVLRKRSKKIDLDVLGIAMAQVGIRNDAAIGVLPKQAVLNAGVVRTDTMRQAEVLGPDDNVIG